MVPAKFKGPSRRDFTKIVQYAYTTNEPFSIGEYKSMVPFTHIESRGLFVDEVKLRKRDGNRFYSVTVYRPSERDWVNIWNESGKWTFSKKRDKTPLRHLRSMYPHHAIPGSLGKKLRAPKLDN